MRRKSERRTKATSTPSSTSDRRTTRRNQRRSKSPTDHHEEKVSDQENECEESKKRDSSSDRDSVKSGGRSRKRPRSTKPTPVAGERGRGRRKRTNTATTEEASGGQEENGTESGKEETNNDEPPQLEEKSFSSSMEIEKDINLISSSRGRSSSRNSEEKRDSEHPSSTENDNSLYENNVTAAKAEQSPPTSSRFDKVLGSPGRRTSPQKDDVASPSADTSIRHDEKDRDADLQSTSRTPLKPPQSKQSPHRSERRRPEKIDRKISVDRSDRDPSPKEQRRSRERRSSGSHERPREKKRREEGEDGNGKVEEKENEKRGDDEQKPSEKKSQPVRKRRWLSRKASESKPQVLAISTDSLKNLISDVKPVPLSDIKLESSSEPEEVLPIQEEKRDRDRSRHRDRRSREREPNKREEKGSLTTNRKISIVNEEGKSLQRPPSPPRNESCNILYITNLVRPFTVLQLKGLLARTGKIVENGFWMDKIKSKCYVKYDTEDQAVETRHALHGVRWPQSNPKCLHVDFGTEAGMEKAVASTLEEGARFGGEGVRDNRLVGTGWDKERLDFDEKKEIQVSRPVREWDVGKKEELEREMERGGRERDRERDVDRNRDRDREGRKWNSSERDTMRDRRRSTSASPNRKYNKKKENDPPLRLLDDLFRKTKCAPCIYWLPLTPEQIAEKEEVRRKNMEEHERRLEEIRKEREQREREKDREREKEREKRRERSNERRKSRDRRRY